MKTEANRKKFIISSVIYLLTFLILGVSYSDFPLDSAQFWLTFWLAYLALVVGSILSVLVGSYLGVAFVGRNIAEVKKVAYVTYLVTVLLLVPLVVFYGQQIHVSIYFYTVLNLIHVLVERFVIWKM